MNRYRTLAAQGLAILVISFMVFAILVTVTLAWIKFILWMWGW